MKLGIQERLAEFFLEYPIFAYKKRAIILFTKDTPQGIFYISKGYVRSYIVSKDGKELTVSLLKEQDIFPLRWAINNFLTSHYYEALTNVELRRVPKSTFLKFLANDPEILLNVTRRILGHLSDMEKRLETAIVGSAKEKVSAMLVYLAESLGKRTGKSIIIPIPFTHSEIANLLGLSRETVSVEMENLLKSKAISQKGRIIKIPQIKKLKSQLKFT